MHVNFKVKGCWHFINQQYPWLHATPNFLCSCDCWDEGCCEGKCPDCTKYLSFKEYFTKQESCLNTEMTIKDSIQCNTSYWQLPQGVFQWQFTILGEIKSLCTIVFYKSNQMLIFGEKGKLEYQCPLCHRNSLTQKPKRLEELWWRSGESIRLPPMWPGFDFQTRRHILVEFVGSLLCSERFFPGFSGFPISSKPVFD